MFNWFRRLCGWHVCEGKWQCVWWHGPVWRYERRCSICGKVEKREMDVEEVKNSDTSEGDDA